MSSTQSNIQNLKFKKEEIVKNFMNECQKVKEDLLKYSEVFIDKNGNIKKFKTKHSLYPELKEKLYQYQNQFFNKIIFESNQELFYFLLYIFKQDCEFKCRFPGCNKLRVLGKNTAGIRIFKFCEEHLKPEYINFYKSYIQKNTEVDSEIIEKRKLTNLKKYGVEVPTQNSEIKNKIKKTWKEKNKNEIKKIVAKREQAFLEKYNVKNPMQAKEIQDKVKLTFFEKYNDYWIKSDEYKLRKEEIQNKIKKTNTEKYGVEYPLQSKEIQDKIKKKNLEKYGTVVPSKNPDIKNKIKESIQKSIPQIKLDKSKHLFKILDINPEIKDKFNSIQSSEEKYKFLVNENIKFITESFLDQNNIFKIKEFCELYKVHPSNAYKILHQLNIDYNKSAGYSNSEKEIVDFIKSIYSGEIIENSRNIISPYELDIYIPEKNLAIEFDGLFWHSFNSKSQVKEYKFKHLKKTQLCEKKGINLLHIFENEWLDPIKREVWKSVLAYKLGVINRKYYARKLRIVEIDSKLASAFFEENHLQGGNANAKIKLALVDKNNIISVMTFSKPRYSKVAQYELIRFASLKYTACVGCAQKLFKYFIEKYHPESVVSYANRRWAFKNKNIYQKLGFEFITEAEPNYYYFHPSDPFKLYHRSQFQKHKLRNHKETKDFFDPSLTETEIMFNSGYRRIYDAGNLVYMWRAKKS